jgi:YHS domain-containing protein
MQRALYDPVDPQLLGSYATGMSFRVNGEWYRFGSEATMRRFMEEPRLWCGLLRDPVSGVRFLPSLHTPEVYFIGGPYYFASDSTRDAFLVDPPRYEIIRR